MKILVANLGSTSFKYSLFEEDANGLQPITQGGYQRVTDYGECIEDALTRMREHNHIQDASEIDAVGFKTVLGIKKTGCVAADDSVVNDLRSSADLAPAHNPAYANGIEQFAKNLPGAKRVALYETAFYQWAEPAGRRYAVPKSWHEAGIKKNGFHGASHKFIAERSAELMSRQDVVERVRSLYHGELKPIEGNPLRVVSCHLGGSSSVTGILNGCAIDTSMGLSPQSGLPQNNRVGELDSMAVTYAMKKLELSPEEIEHQLTKESGLLGLSGVSNDIRDIIKAAESGNADAQLAIESLIYSIRHYIGAYAFQMGGLDAIVFTAGIGENSTNLRAEVCAGLEEFGIELDPEINQNTKGVEATISSDYSRVKVYVIPANEEIVVARETLRFLQRTN